VLILATLLLASVGFPAPSPETVKLMGRAGTSPPQSVEVEIPSAQPEVTSASSLRTRLHAAWWTALEGAVFRASEQELTDDGRHIQIVLRFIGPILVGLALLSVRGRVKR
jgi:hypothetical protein